MNNEEYNVQENTGNRKKKKLTKTEKIISLILGLMITIPLFHLFFKIQQDKAYESMNKYSIVESQTGIPTLILIYQFLQKYTM